MLQLKDRSVTPPGYWRYKQPDGPMLEGGDFGQLVLNVLKYRVDHGLATGDIAAEVEDEICRRTGAKCGPPRPVPDGAVKSIGVAEVWRFLMTMKEWLKDGSLVEQEEAERRAEICAGCFQNRDIEQGCWGCAGIEGTVLAIIGDRRTRMDHVLRNCAVCSCYNSVSVWVPLPVLQKASGDLQYPESTTGSDPAVPCWKRTIPLAPESQ